MMLDKLWLQNVCFQEEIPQIPHSELTDLKVIDQGGFGVVYRAKHPRFNTVVYKELNVQKLSERYSVVAVCGLTTLHTMYNNEHVGFSGE